MTPRGWRVVSAGACAGLMLSTAACGVGLESLPLPAPGVSGDYYTLYALFDNALNLPAQAKVKLQGADIGEVEAMRVQNYEAIVTMRIKDGISLPVGAGAELRSATPLGDVFVAVEPPPGPASNGALLSDGDSIPIASTSSAATIEELLTTSSFLINGGVLRNLTKVVNGLGEAVGGRGEEMADLIGESTALIGTLSSRSNEIRETLASTNQLLVTVSEQQSSIDDAISAAGPALGTLNANTAQMLDLLAQVAQVSSQVGKFPSVSGTGAGGMVADINTIAAELNDAATDPNASLAAVNRLLPPLLKITNSTSAHVNADLEQLAIGAIADPNHPADPGSRLPDSSDWDALVGTITYTLMRLQGRVLGTGR
ncbi:MCE family protein [Rhodococcus sp. AD45-ID]|uniref:MlaD family protein n=1 Tax=unclassified Rhodococcus (in: high G+C Gram-positive bacteria) TaxID=192944 RepID=UPI0005D3EE39|nr:MULTISPECIES: MlaD family protein [unclassified Rhodococcus (in: high G+C Gram-positive bacteria)]KJF23872.1 virulence factor Mce family protein [Rhodococcus sp. AD45]PSR42243.1 MCE family protein [Rhodococcus sp. AD45-ID]